MTLFNRIRNQASAAELPAAAVFRMLMMDVLLAAPSFTTRRWRFHIADESADICTDAEWGGSGARERVMSCGMALALMGVAAHHRGVALQIQSRLDGGDPLATIRIGERLHPRREDHALFRAMIGGAPRTHVYFDIGVGHEILRELRVVSARRGARFEAFRGEGIGLASNDAFSAASRIPTELQHDSGPTPFGPTFGAVVTPGDQPHDWLAAGEANVMLQLTGVRHGVHMIPVASTTPMIRALRPKARGLLHDCDNVQVLMILGRSLRRDYEAKQRDARLMHAHQECSHSRPTAS